MGGKNPTIVTTNADLDKATDGVLRSAFGYGGQKCSANSRVYVHRSVYDEFVAPLKDEDREDRDRRPAGAGRTASGPVIDEGAVETFEQAVGGGEEERHGSSPAASGSPRATSRKGTFVQPTVAEVPLDSWIWKRGAVRAVRRGRPVSTTSTRRSALANDTEYGLTAGFYSEDRGRDRRFLSSIEAGVVYVNRRAGATTGAWPGVQPFGGWKGSGTTRQGGRRPLLRAAVPARAVPDGDRGVSATDTEHRLGDLAERAGAPARHRGPGARGAGADRARPQGHESRRSRAPTRSSRARGAGSVVEDVDGNLFLDLNAGIAVTSTGHCHPEVVEAIQRQAERAAALLGERLLPAHLLATSASELDQIAPFERARRGASSRTRGPRRSRRRSSSRATRPGGST